MPSHERRAKARAGERIRTRRLGNRVYRNLNSTTTPQNCSICLDTITMRGRLSTCSHWFCFECIQEWSKNTNTCPLCKTRFRCISQVPLDTSLNDTISKVRVRDKDQSILSDYQQDDYEMAMGLLNDTVTTVDRYDDSDFNPDSTHSSVSTIVRSPINIRRRDLMNDPRMNSVDHYNLDNETTHTQPTRQEGRWMTAKKASESFEDSHCDVFSSMNFLNGKMIPENSHSARKINTQRARSSSDESVSESDYEYKDSDNRFLSNKFNNERLDFGTSLRDKENKHLILAPTSLETLVVRRKRSRSRPSLNIYKTGIAKEKISRKRTSPYSCSTKKSVERNGENSGCSFLSDSEICSPYFKRKKLASADSPSKANFSFSPSPIEATSPSKEPFSKSSLESFSVSPCMLSQSSAGSQSTSRKFGTVISSNKQFSLNDNLHLGTFSPNTSGDSCSTSSRTEPMIPVKGKRRHRVVPVNDFEVNL